MVNLSYNDSSFKMNVSVLFILYFIHIIYATPPKCPSSLRSQPCTRLDFHHKYRAIDGSCNNLANPAWGSAGTPFLRHMQPQYEDRSNLPVGSFDVLYSGYPKPNAREVSQIIMAGEKPRMDSRHNAMLAHWGQFIAHDMSLSKESEFNCTTRATDRDQCFNIIIPKNDKRMPIFGNFPVKRSQSCSHFGMREQINKLTSYLDASQIYGTNNRLARKLKVRGGKLRINRFYKSSTGLPYLSFDETESEVGCFRNKSKSGVKCFLAGDPRANEQLILTAIHTAFLREHNRIAEQLARINPEWSEDIVYYETRKIIGAIVQHVTYDHWLPKILGPVAYDLIGQYEGYQKETNAAIANSVATAAMRFGHAFVVPKLKRLNSRFLELTKEIKLRDAFFAPHLLMKDGGIDSLLRGAVGSPVKEIAPVAMLNNELTEHLFPNAHKFPLDLAALNIQRGRDHGLPSYNQYRELCGLQKFTSFQHMKEEIRDDTTVEKLAKLYGHPDNLDLWVGGLFERPLRDAKVGRTFACLLVDQFKRLRSGDRFWYENPDVLGKTQLESIKNYSLSKLFCKAFDEPNWMPNDIFTYYPLTIRQFEKCSDLPELNLTLWRIESDGYAQSTECSSVDCVCRYRIGLWGICDPLVSRQYRKDKLVTGRYPPCTEERIVTRLCGVKKKRNNRVFEVKHFNGRNFNGNRRFGNLLSRRQKYFSNIRSGEQMMT